MALVKLTDTYPNYREQSPQLGNIKDFSVYTQSDEKVGSVHDILIDTNTERFRYFVLDVGPWILGKKVLLPVGQARLDQAQQRLYVTGLTKEQVEKLPEFDDLKKVDTNYEEQVRGVYRTNARPSEMPLETPTVGTATTMMATSPVAQRPLEDNTIDQTMAAGSPVAAPGYSYDRDPDLYNLNDRDHQDLKLYEERLVAGKHREKVGEVVVGKRVETEQVQASVPIERERVVIERVAPTDATVVDQADFDNVGEVARVEVYEEVPEIHKETFVREEVRVRKVVEQENVTADETIRREELDMNTQGNPHIDGAV